MTGLRNDNDMRDEMKSFFLAASRNTMHTQRSSIAMAFEEHDDGCHRGMIMTTKL